MSRSEQLALAELELARVELACRFDDCGPDCAVRCAVSRSVESLRNHPPVRRRSGVAA